MGVRSGFRRINLDQGTIEQEVSPFAPQKQHAIRTVPKRKTTMR